MEIDFFHASDFASLDETSELGNWLPFPAGCQQSCMINLYISFILLIALAASSSSTTTTTSTSATFSI